MLSAQGLRKRYKQREVVADFGLTLIGDFNIHSPSGSNSGQKMVYNLRTGAIQGGGDGSRVRTVIQPRNAQGK